MIRRLFDAGVFGRCWYGSAQPWLAAARLDRTFIPSCSSASVANTAEINPLFFQKSLSFSFSLCPCLSLLFPPALICWSSSFYSLPPPPLLCASVPAGWLCGYSRLWGWGVDGLSKQTPAPPPPPPPHTTPAAPSLRVLRRAYSPRYGDGLKQRTEFHHFNQTLPQSFVLFIYNVSKST